MVGDLPREGALWDVRELGSTHPNRRPPMEREVGLDAQELESYT